MSLEKKLRAGIYKDVNKICAELGPQLDVQFDDNALNLIGELIFKKLVLYSSDLEAYQKHAKRSTVNIDDVKLLVRRNDSLKSIVEEKCKTLKKHEPVPSVKRKRTKSTTTNVILE